MNRPTPERSQLGMRFETERDPIRAHVVERSQSGMRFETERDPIRAAFGPWNFFALAAPQRETYTPTDTRLLTYFALFGLALGLLIATLVTLFFVQITDAKVFAAFVAATLVSAFGCLLFGLEALRERRESTRRERQSVRRGPRS